MVFVRRWLLFTVIFMMSKSIDQRICIKFCVVNQINFTQTLEMLRKAYLEDCLSRTRVFEWHKAFKEGREAVDRDESRFGHPSTSTDDEHVAQVKALVLKNRRMSVRELAVEVRISKTMLYHFDWNVGHETCRFIRQLIHRWLFVSFWPKTQPISFRKFYIPDMAPCDFFLFPKLKLSLRGCFESIKAIKENSLRELKTILQSAGAFEEEALAYMCIVSNGEYFVGDKINIDE